jgi:hypothetical protein
MSAVCALHSDMSGSIKCRSRPLVIEDYALIADYAQDIVLPSLCRSITKGGQRCRGTFTCLNSSADCF